MKNITQALKVITLALILSFGISYVYAWTAPTVTPPNGNVSAPINTSATSQYKEGILGVGGLLKGYANAVFDGSVGIGTTNPSSKLHVDGNPQTINALLRVSTNDDNNGPARNILDWSYVPGVLISNDWDGDAATSNSTKIAKLVLNTASGGYNSGGSIHVEGAGGYDQGQLVFSTGWNSSNNATERMRINAAGNVGIGGSLTASSLNTGGTVTATGNIQGQHIKFPGVGGDSGAGADFYGIYQESGPWSYPYPDLRIQYHTGIKYDAYAGYGGHQFYTGYDQSGTPTGLQMQITDKVYVSNDVCTTAGKCLSAAQPRVTGSCAVGQAITAINADGTVLCGSSGGSGFVKSCPYVINGVTYDGVIMYHAGTAERRCCGYNTQYNASQFTVQCYIY